MSLNMIYDNCFISNLTQKTKRRAFKMRKLKKRKLITPLSFTTFPSASENVGV